MGTVLGLLLLVALIGGSIKYQSFKVNGFRPRNFTTRLSADAVQEIFEAKVAGMGWTLASENGTVVAQSGLLSGIRQQIGLTLQDGPQGLEGRIAVLRYSKKVFGGATKAYTLRMRMNAFLGELQRRDASAAVAG